MTPPSDMQSKYLDLTTRNIDDLDLKVKYAVTMEEHQANVAENLKLGYPSVQPGDFSDKTLALVCSGPSLKRTRRQIRFFDYILTCSGAHDYLINHGIVPTWHMEGDPRAHKAVFVKHPHKRVKYLISTACHPKLFANLKGYQVAIWHSLMSGEHLSEMDHYPPGHWVLTGGTNVGMRAMVMGRLLGFTQIHIFGMDCSAEDSFHTGDHPNEPPKKKYMTIQVGEREFYTTHLFLSYAKQFFHEILMLPDTQVVMHGDGLLQALVAMKLSDPAQLEEFVGKRDSIQETTVAVMQRPLEEPHAAAV